LRRRPACGRSCSRIVSRAAAQLAASFHPEGLAIAVGAALDGATLATLREKISATQQRAAIVLANIHLPHLPTRTEVFGRAAAMFTKTSSMDEIVDRAHIAYSRYHRCPAVGKHRSSPEAGAGVSSRFLMMSSRSAFSGPARVRPWTS
jgi:hypothetical protein